MARITAGNPGAPLRALALAALIVGLAAAGPEKRATVSDVSLQEIGAATEVSFSTDEAVKVQDVEVNDPTLIVIDVMGANNTLPRSTELKTSTVSTLKTDMWHTGDGTPVTRVTFCLTGSARHWLEPRDKGFTVMIEPAGAAGEAPATATATPETAPPAAPAESTPSSSTSTTENPASGAESAAPAAAPAAASTETAPVSPEGTPAVSTPAPAAPSTPAEPGQSETWGEVMVESPVPASPAAPEAQAAPAAPKTEAAPETESPRISPVEEMLRSQPITFEPSVNDKSSRFADGGPRVSLDVQGADIRTVMRSLAEYSGTNIVVGREVTGSVTVNLMEVPWVDALNTICRTQGLGWVDEQGIIRVETLENLRKEDVARSTADKQIEDLQPLTTQIVRAVYATCTELKPAIEKTLTSRGHIEVDNRTNSLVITDVSRRVGEAVAMVKHLDSRTPQIEITAKLVDVDARYTRDLGINWGLGQIHSSDQAASGELDIKANSVVDPAANVRFGLVRSWGTINAMLSALEQDNKADIISNPRITTVNNREAKILVGRKVPLIVLDQAGNAVTQLTTVGITLRVTPHINDDDRITLDLHPEVSDLASQATVQGGIIINTSEADTRVIVDDGETAVIGGLIRSNTSRLKRGVPILRDVPILGYIFSSTNEVKEKRELLIFITPRIITNWTQTG